MPCYRDTLTTVLEERKLCVLPVLGHPLGAEGQIPRVVAVVDQ